jgi:hypothetical protein
MIAGSSVSIIFLSYRKFIHSSRYMVSRVSLNRVSKDRFDDMLWHGFVVHEKEKTIVSTFAENTHVHPRHFVK